MIDEDLDFEVPTCSQCGNTTRWTLIRDVTAQESLSVNLDVESGIVETIEQLDIEIDDIKDEYLECDNCGSNVYLDDDWEIQ